MRMASSSCRAAGWSAHLLVLGPHRHLAKDFDSLPETLATFVTLASIQLAVRRSPGRRPKVGKSEVKGPSPSPRVRSSEALRRRPLYRIDR